MGAVGLLVALAPGPGSTSGEFLERNSGYFNVNVNSIQQRSANLGHVTIDFRRRALAISARIIAVSTGTRVPSLAVTKNLKSRFRTRVRIN